MLNNSGPRVNSFGTPIIIYRKCYMMNLLLSIVFCLISNLALVLMKLDKSHMLSVLQWVTHGRGNQKPSINLIKYFSIIDRASPFF